MDGWTTQKGEKKCSIGQDLLQIMQALHNFFIDHSIVPLGLINIFHFHYTLHYIYVILFYRSRFLLILQQIAASYTFLAIFKESNKSGI